MNHLRARICPLLQAARFEATEKYISIVTLIYFPDTSLLKILVYPGCNIPGSDWFYPNCAEQQHRFTRMNKH